MSDLLIELFQEEIPARMQAAAEENLARLVTERFKASGIAFQSCTAYSTPRRLTLHVTGIPAVREDVSEELKGPAVTAPEAAIQGFLKKAGISSVAELTARDVKGTSYYFYESVKKGGQTIDVLGDLIAGAIIAMPWPKSMRWGNSTMRWVRPLQNILAIFDGKVVAGTVDVGGGQSFTFNNRTAGHRFLSDGAYFEVASFEDYRAKLLAAKVLLARSDRKEKIWADVNATAKAAGFTVKDDERLLDEVVGLVEWPVPFMGGFDEHFLEIPAEVISTSMRENQRYFSVVGKDGKLVNRFITLANIQPTDDGKTIVYGNEKVLRARLSDARFFWDQDLKKKLEEYLPRLEQIRFHEKLGMMSEKSMRLEELASSIAALIGADQTAAARAGKLCKADLVTGMVKEFPEIQGIMGGYYAKAAGETAAVAAAISTHYAPAGPNDKCPVEPVAVAVALADKLDTLVGFFLIGEKPTGSKDPFALRRAALGIIRLVLENNLAVSLKDMLALAARGFSGSPVPQDLEAFILERFKVMMKGENHPHNIIEAVLGENLLDQKNRIVQLSSFLTTQKGQDFVQAAKRAINILETEEKKAGGVLTGQVSEQALVAPEEKSLFVALQKVGPKFTSFIKAGDYEGAMTCLADMKDTVDLFFDKVVVNDNNTDIRANRLAMLSTIRGLASQIADFSRL